MPILFLLAAGLPAAGAVVGTISLAAGQVQDRLNRRKLSKLLPEAGEFAQVAVPARLDERLHEAFTERGVQYADLEEYEIGKGQVLLVTPHQRYLLGVALDMEDRKVLLWLVAQLVQQTQAAAAAA